MSFDFSKIEDENLRTQLEEEFTKASSKDGLFTQSDIDKEVNRVSQKLSQEMRDMKNTYKKEFEEEMKLDAEGKAKKILDDANAKMFEISKKENKLEVMELLAENKIDPKEVSDMVDLLVSDDKESTLARANSYIKTHVAMTNKIKQEIMDGVEKPDGSKTSKAAEKTDKETFDSLSYAEKIEFKQNHPEEFKAILTGK